MFPKVYIIILNWNGWKDTIECLESVFRIDYPNYQVIVVDNGSTDGSVEKIKAWAKGEINIDLNSNTFLERFFSTTLVKPIDLVEIKDDGISKKLYRYRLVLIKSCKNLGYAGGNNLGVRFALSNYSDYIFLINNDVIVDRFVIQNFIDLSENKDGAGILGPKVYFYDNPNVIQSFGANINLWSGRGILIGQGEFDSHKYDLVLEVDWVSGAAMFIKKEVFEKVGVLDAGYFLCYEDTDFCLRAKKKGFKILVVPSSKIWHKGAHSLNRPLAEYYLTLNRVRFMKLNSDPIHFSVFLIFYLVGSLKRFCISLLKNDIKTAEAILKGFLLGLMFVFKKADQYNEKKQ